MAVGAQQPRPEGAWRLDLSHSDSATTRFGRGSTPAAAPGERPGVGGPGGDGPGGSGPGYGPPGTEGPGGERGPGADIAGGRRFGGGRYGRGMSEKDMVRIRQTLELLRAAPAQVRISIKDGSFTTIDSTGAEQTLRIGETVVSPPPIDSGGTVKTSARWKGDALIVERKVDGGGRVKESYGLGLDGSRMIVFVELTIGAMPRTLTRQYVKSEE